MFGLASCRAPRLAVRGILGPPRASAPLRGAAQATLAALEDRLVRGERVGGAELRGGLLGALVALRAAEAETAGHRAGMEEARGRADEARARAEEARARADLAAALGARALDEAHARAEEAAARVEEVRQATALEAEIQARELRSVVAVVGNRVAVEIVTRVLAEKSGKGTKGSLSSMFAEHVLPMLVTDRQGRKALTPFGEELLAPLEGADMVNVYSANVAEQLSTLYKDLSREIHFAVDVTRPAGIYISGRVFLRAAVALVVRAGFARGALPDSLYRYADEDMNVLKVISAEGVSADIRA